MCVPGLWNDDQQTLLCRFPLSSWNLSGRGFSRLLRCAECQNVSCDYPVLGFRQLYAITPPPPFGTKGGIEIEGNQIKSDQSINVYGIQSVAELHLFWMFLTNMLGASRSSMDLGLQSKHLLRLAKSMGIVSRVRISSLLYIFCHCCCTIINHSSSLPVVVPLNQRLWVPF